MAKSQKPDIRKTKDDSVDFPLPPEKVYRMVVIDLTMKYDVPTNYDGKTGTVDRPTIVMEISKKRPDGERYRLYRTYPSDSLSSKSTFMKDWGTVIDRLFDDLDDDADGGEEINLYDIVGFAGQVSVKHNTVKKDGKDKVYANIDGILDLGEGQKPLKASGSYIADHLQEKEGDVDKLLDKDDE